MIKNYVIGISNNEMSQQYLKLCIPNIKNVTVNDEVNLWEGTVPETIPDGPLRFDLKDPTKGTKGNPPFTESEKAIWYSHFLLWNHIYDNKENAWIFEHDIDFKNTILLPDVEEYDIAFAKAIGSADCYYLSYNFAKKLIEYVKSKPLKYQVDTFLHYVLVTKKIIGNYKNLNLKVNQMRHLGRVAEHS